MGGPDRRNGRPLARRARGLVVRDADVRRLVLERVCRVLGIPGPVTDTVALWVRIAAAVERLAGK